MMKLHPNISIYQLICICLDENNKESVAFRWSADEGRDLNCRYTLLCCNDTVLWRYVLHAINDTQDVY